jgi:choline dehydrogenase
MARESDPTFDFVIVGGGSAGCVLANRLSADPSLKVALVEAGGKDNWIWFHIPVGYLFAIGNPRADWLFRTVEEPGLNGRSLNYPRGRVIGGCSAINAMIYMRGQREDYDQWRQMGLNGWAAEDVWPLFLQMEDHIDGASPHHGADGEWRVEHPRMRWEILDSFVDAAASRGIPLTNDFNTGSNEGVGYFQVNQKKGVRWSAAKGFLKPVMSRPNLTVFTGAEAEKLVLDGRRATGVKVRIKGKARTIMARREVVLTAGAIGTPVLLQRSGIGGGAFLQEMGVPVAIDLPGVGANLQDHLQLRPIYKVFDVRTMNSEYRSLWKRMKMGIDYALFRKGPLTMAPSQLGCFTRSSARHATPNIQFHVQPLSLDKFGDPLHPFDGMTVSVCNLRPTSRGQVRIASPKLEDKPVIAPHYLSTAEDRRVAVESVQLARHIMAAEPMKRYRPEEILPGPDVQSELDLEKAAGQIGTTIFHPVGTACMGLPEDRMSVVDERLRVKHVAGLRIADASVMPTITSGNTNSPTMMIAEKAAQMIRQDMKQ